MTHSLPGSTTSWTYLVPFWSAHREDDRVDEVERGARDGERRLGEPGHAVPRCSGAWKVVRHPEPDAAAWNRTWTSSPLDSPRMTKSGLSLRLSLTRSKSETFEPSDWVCLVWSGFHPLCGRLISRVSSMERTFQFGLITVPERVEQRRLPGGRDPGDHHEPPHLEEHPEVRGDLGVEHPRPDQLGDGVGDGAQLADAEAASQARHLLSPGGREPVALGQDAVDDGRRDGERAVRPVDEPRDGRRRASRAAGTRRSSRASPRELNFLCQTFTGPPEALAGDVLDLRVPDQRVDGGVSEYLSHEVVRGRLQVVLAEPGVHEPRPLQLREEVAQRVHGDHR